MRIKNMVFPYNKKTTKHHLKPGMHGRMDVQIDGQGYILVLLCDNGNQK
jgi:hypothetical protein